MEASSSKSLSVAFGFALATVVYALLRTGSVDAETRPASSDLSSRVESLARTNADLQRKLADVEPEIEALQRKIEELDRRVGPGTSPRIGSKGSVSPESAMNMIEFEKFRERVRAALAPELEELAELRQAADHHRHTYEKTYGGSWTPMAADCDGCLINVIRPGDPILENPTAKKYETSEPD